MVHRQWVSREAYTLSPAVPVEEYTDIFGNLCQRLVAPAGTFSVHTSADVMTADVVDKAPGAFFVEIQNLPDAVLTYLLPSRYCESDRFGDLARDLVDGVQPGYDQVQQNQRLDSTLDTLPARIQRISTVRCRGEWSA